MEAQKVWLVIPTAYQDEDHCDVGYYNEIQAFAQESDARAFIAQKYVENRRYWPSDANLPTPDQIRYKKAKDGKKAYITYVFCDTRLTEILAYLRQVDIA